MNRDHGFTLVEALVAFAILAVVLAVLYQAIGSGLRLSSHADETSKLAAAARSLYDTISPADLLGSGAPVAAVPGTPWRWRLTVAPPAADQQHGTVQLRHFTIDMLGPDGEAPLLTVESARLVVVP